ncbi:hypothetical protein [Amycolatopsis anabasis]|uniref:hypothetical protein n=1 Tax=Amycolatopsis anabasis TaxID=1840409 RepID=UPI00131BFB7D|nr:hypothetical protein [Amycolatopsis anabasis]
MSTDESAESPGTPQPAAEPGNNSSGDSPPDQAEGRKDDAVNEQDAPEMNRAYWRGQRFYDMRGNTTLMEHANIREMQVGDRYFFVGQGVSCISGSIREEILRWTRDRYVPIRNYPDMRKTLAELRLALLRGVPGTGRATTALHLLDAVAKGKVYRLDVGAEIKSMSEADLPHQGCGYFVELSRRAENSLTEAHLDKLRDLLEKRDAYCVLIGGRDLRQVDSFGGYAMEYEPPDPRELLERHIRHEVRVEDDEDLERRLAELVLADWVHVALGPRPRPMESTRMAALLVDHARGVLDRSEVERRATQAVPFQVAEWFAELQGLRAGEDLDEGLGLAAFRIALGVLNESPYHLVAEAARKLARRFVEATASENSRQTSLLADDPERRLPALRAEFIDGQAIIGTARVPMRLLAFQDERYPVTVLRHVWENHHRMRAAISSWLMKLSKDPRPLVWVRAAQAAGYLCSLDYTYAFTKLITPGIYATGDNWMRRRLFAAIALDQAAQEDQVLQAIRGWLRRWRRRGDEAERWTAAATLGFGLGLRYIDHSLEELRILGTPSERLPVLADEGGSGLVWVAGYSLSKLFAFGAVEPVLDRLNEWVRSERRSLRRLALETVNQLTDLYGFELRFLDMSAGRKPGVRAGRERWPLLLTLQEADDRLTEPFADLLRRSLRARGGDGTAKRLLGRWIRSGEKDAECLGVLLRFLPHLIERSDDAHRLYHLVNRMRRDWAEPLPVDVARQLETVIEGSMLRGRAS